jgi:hypothetical protein
MKHRLTQALLLAMLALVCASGTLATDWWASEVISSSRLGNSPYDDPLATLGKPTIWMNNSGAPGEPNPCAVSMVISAWNVGWPSGEKLVTTVRAASNNLPAGHITVKFATPIYDDPENWYGKDFIIFGNSFFAVGGSYVYSDSNMEEVIISSYNGQGGFWEPMPVSVSQDGVNWYSYTNGPYADDYAPTQALAWDWVENRWLKNSAGNYVELDFTRPVLPSYTKADFDQKSVSEAIDMFRGSGGGTAFDLADLPLPIDPVTGRKWIQYIKVDGANGEVDAFARVSHSISPISIGEAKKLPDGAKVTLRECVVSAATYEVGRYCYVEHPDRSGGIRVMGRALERNKHYIIYGDMDTIGGERVIQATAITQVDGQNDPVTALGIPNRSIHGYGLSTAGLLIRTWGKVLSVNQDDKSFVIDDGSAVGIKVVPPRDTQAAEPNNGVVVHPDFIPPSHDQFVIVTGISSLEADGQGGFVPAVRLRDINDMQ